jgi:octaprenyl-diphosphate synthase
MSNGSAAERDLIRHAIEHGEVERLDEIIQIVRRTGALEATRQAARDEAQRAQQHISALPSSQFKDALLTLSVLAVDRNA